LCFNGLLRLLSGHDGPQYFKLNGNKRCATNFWRERKCK